MQPVIKQGWLRALIFLVALLLIILGTATLMLLLYPKLIQEEGVSPQQLLYIRLTVYSIASYFTVLLFCKVIDRQPVNTLGLEWEDKKAHAVSGFLLGVVLLGAGTLLLVALGNLEWIDIVPDGRSLFINLGLMAIIAFTEELVFRGYILNNLMQSMNKWIALCVSALLFAAFHSANPGIHPVAIINLFLGGLLLGVNYIFTKNLWFAIFFHFTWNYYQGSILGYDVSGINMSSVLDHDLTGHPLITGGAFGFEGSVISGVLCLLATLILAYVYANKRLRFNP